jgi:hypothetical protein
MKNGKHPIGKRTRNFTDGIAVPQQNAPPLAARSK